MNLEGVVSRLWLDPSENPPVVSLVLQGDKTIYRFFVHEVSAETVGLTKPGDNLQVVLRACPINDSATQWNNQTLDADTSM